MITQLLVYWTRGKLDILRRYLDAFTELGSSSKHSGRQSVDLAVRSQLPNGDIQTAVFHLAEFMSTPASAVPDRSDLDDLPEHGFGWRTRVVLTAGRYNVPVCRPERASVSSYQMTLPPALQLDRCRGCVHRSLPICTCRPSRTPTQYSRSSQHNPYMPMPNPG